MVRQGGKLAGRFCIECDKWYKPKSKYQKKCNECKKHSNQYKPKKEPIEQSEILKHFYEKYELHQ